MSDTPETGAAQPDRDAPLPDAPAGEERAGSPTAQPPEVDQPTTAAAETPVEEPAAAAEATPPAVPTPDEEPAAVAEVTPHEKPAPDAEPATVAEPVAEAEASVEVAASVEPAAAPAEPVEAPPTASEPVPAPTVQVDSAPAEPPGAPAESPATPAEPRDTSAEPAAGMTEPAAGPETPAAAAKPPVPTPAQVVHPPAAQTAPSSPAAPAAAPAAAAAAVAASDPSEWGRVADDGTVYVRTAEGERPVGSYPDASPEEALAYFGRKFDELAGQVDLLEQRVRAGGIAPKDAGSTLTHLQEAVTEANAVGDLAALLTRLDAVATQIEERRKRSEAARAKAREAAAASKERIVEEAEKLSTSSDWKRAGDRLRELLEEWKKAPRLERKVDDALWKRFSHARTAFDKRRRVHFAELDEQRGEAAARKEKLIKKAEELSTSKEWGDTARAYRDLMTEWKAAGRARRDVEDKLWERFRAAQDVFFAARAEVFAERDAGQAENLEKKRSLASEAEALLPITDLKSARAALRHVHEQWEAVGHVPRSDRDAVENRLKKVDDAVRAAEEAEWARSNPEARARAEATVSQLRTSIASLEADAAKARTAGNEKKAADAESAAEARRSWLVEAERTLAEFS